MAPHTEPGGALLGRWTMAACHDSRGQPHPEPDSEVRIVRTAAGNVVLVEEHEGYDTFVVTNVSAAGTDRVYQLALKRTSFAPSLREYRIPDDPSKPGRFSLVKQVRAWNDGEPRGAFTAKYTEAALACELRPVGEGAPGG